MTQLTASIENEIREIVGLHPEKVRQIYMFGSRVYGYNRPDSDHDIFVIAANIDAKTEIKGNKYNIHIHTPDIFKDGLFNHEVKYLECIFAPPEAKLYEPQPVPFTLNKDRLKKKFLNTAKASWEKGGMNIRQSSIEYGIKSCFHAMRILMFGKQIAAHGRIVDFAEANELWKEMNSQDFYEWFQVKDEYLHKKIQLEKQLKAL